jgi:hypothetical protein
LGPTKRFLSLEGPLTRACHLALYDDMKICVCLVVLDDHVITFTNCGCLASLLVPLESLVRFSNFEQKLLIFEQLKNLVFLK